tara:strand:+ start:1102 stop:1287 length:186 start_codon:yes stop_codon:yes gene_type:complete
MIDKEQKTYTYKFVRISSQSDSETTGVLRIEDNAFIPVATDNPDYLDYLEWAKTNTTKPAD